MGNGRSDFCALNSRASFTVRQLKAVHQTMTFSGAIRLGQHHREPLARCLTLTKSQRPLANSGLGLSLLWHRAYEPTKCRITCRTIGSHHRWERRPGSPEILLGRTCLNIQQEA